MFKHLSVLFKIVTFSALETSHSLACTFYKFVKVCRCFNATNENIHVLSMKFPHLFLRPEIIITFMWDGSGVGGRCDTALRGILVYLQKIKKVNMEIYVSQWEFEIS